MDRGLLFDALRSPLKPQPAEGGGGKPPFPAPSRLRTDSPADEAPVDGRGGWKKVGNWLLHDSRREGYFSGRRVRVAEADQSPGRVYTALKVLAGGAGGLADLAMGDLLRSVCPGAEGAATTCRTYLSTLRGLLRSAFGLGEENPLPVTGRGENYRVSLNEKLLRRAGEEERA